METGLNDAITNLRLADVSDAARCAWIVNNWIDKTEWITRVHSRASIEEMLIAGIPVREFWVAGEPIQGYLSFNHAASQVMGLYTARQSLGIGKALLDKVKQDRKWIQLWSHSANTQAHRFYTREGFVKTNDTRIGDDQIPEVRLEGFLKGCQRIGY